MVTIKHNDYDKKSNYNINVKKKLQIIEKYYTFLFSIDPLTNIL